MALEHNHYERAFAAHLRSRGIPCIPVDESRRAFDSALPIKSLDFLVNVPGQDRILLIDVKGRRLEGGSRSLENWTTVDDLDGMRRWGEIFGPRAEPMFVFLYHLTTDVERMDFVDDFQHAERRYGCLVIPLTDYAPRAKVRSPRWNTVSIPRSAFRQYAKPFSQCLQRFDDGVLAMGPCGAPDDDSGDDYLDCFGAALGG